MAPLTPVLRSAGSVIYQQTDLAGHCYYAVCSLDCHVVRRTDHACPTGSPAPATATSPPVSSPSTSVHVTKTGCPNAVPPRTVTASVPLSLGAREAVRGPLRPAEQAVASSGPLSGLCRLNTGRGWKRVFAT
ncbi:Mucin-5AC [Pteropus alecto]|uniref:Mucin-5AC n=1 Tax=Pteropus alecto TaxID=9402 RepID=L5KPF3_PTEAL|nr:Mucin-5AC [Pteropus alecto]